MNGEHEVLFIDEYSHAAPDYLLQPCGSQLGLHIKGGEILQDAHLFFAACTDTGML